MWEEERIGRSTVGELKEGRRKGKIKKQEEEKVK